MPSVEVWPNKHVDEQAPEDLPGSFRHSISRGSPRKLESEIRPSSSDSEAQQAEKHPKNLPRGEQPSIAEAYAYAGLAAPRLPILL